MNSPAFGTRIPGNHLTVEVGYQSDVDGSYSVREITSGPP